MLNFIVRKLIIISKQDLKIYLIQRKTIYWNLIFFGQLTRKRRINSKQDLSKFQHL